MKLPRQFFASLAIGAPAPLRELPVRLERMNVSVDLADQLAATTMDLVFRNSSDRDQEATLLFPAPPGAAIDDFTMTVNGETLEGELLGRAEAARIYADAYGKDPQFYDFYRAMQSYKKTFLQGEGQSTMVLSEDSEYFRQFKGER